MSYSHRGTPAPRIQAPTQQPPPLDSIPETILIECARNTAPSINVGLNSDPASWTNNFDGGIQIKKGDAISINSATLNSVGVGSLINFTLEGEKQNNKATWIHSFYVTNDGKNDKRSSINMNTVYNGGQGMFRFDTTNNDCDLFRWTNTGADTDDAARTVTYYQDNFLPLRVGHTEVDVISSSQPLNLSTQQMCINILSDTFGAAQPTGNATYFSVNNVAVDGTLGSIVDIINKNIFQRGRVYRMTPVSIPSLTDPNQYKDSTYNAIFGVVEIFQNTSNDRITAPDGQYVKCTPLGDTINTSDANRQSFQIKSVNFDMITGEVNFGDVAGDAYQYTPAFFDWESQLFNPNDDVYQADYELLDPNGGTTPAANKQINPLISNSQVPKGKVIVSNVLKYNINILEMPSGGGGVYPQQGYPIGNFKFKLNDITYDDIAAMVSDNDEVKQFGIRIYTATGYKYALLFLGQNNDLSTISNKNTITVNSARGSQIYFGVNEIPPLDDVTSGNVILTNDIPVPLDSVDNPHQILFIGKLSSNVSVRFYNTVKQSFLGNFSLNKNLRTPSAVIDDIVFLKSPIETPTILFNADYTNVFPVHINGYSGGVMRSFDYFQEDDTTRVSQFDENFEYIKHYEHFSYEINSSWNSPSDIATELTDQTHTPQPAKTSTGLDITDSTNKGIPHNRLCIPVWTTNQASEADLLTNSNLEEGSFKIVDPVYKDVAATPAFQQDALPQKISQNNVDIFFRTSQTSINYPSSIINTPRNLNYNAANPVNKSALLPPDFNQGNSLMGSTDYIRTAKSIAANGNTIEYPLTYINGEDARISQFAGANDISFGWDDNISRFTIGNLHVGIFSLAQIGDPSTAGQEEVKIYVPALTYKQNQTRSGGIFIENWYSIQPTTDISLETIINQIGATYDFTFVPEWFLTASNRDPIGKRFWNKLGYDDSQIGVSGSFVGVSTRNEIDTAVSIVPTNEPAANRPAYSELGNFASDNNSQGGASGTAIAGFEFSSFGNLNFNNHAVGMGNVANTEGSPLQYFPNVAPTAGLNRIGITHLTTGSGNEADSMIDSEGQYNPDREFNTYYTVSTKDDMTTTLDALNLPVKTEFSYFYILSNLVESKFYSSKNGGMPINCIGTINKLNSDNDFYFSYSSPQRIYATKDRVLTSITTTIKDIDFSTPAIIGDFSSVIYQIDRFNPIPEPIPPSIAVQQEEYYSQLTDLTEEVLKESNLPSNEANVEQVLEDLYVGGEPTSDRAEIVQDVIEYGLQIQQQENVAALQSITQDFLTTRKEEKGKITKREFKNYLDQRKDIPDEVKEEALLNWKSIEESRQGLEAARQSGVEIDPSLIARTRRGDYPRRGRRPVGERRPPPYILPPPFEEQNPRVEDEE